MAACRAARRRIARRARWPNALVGASAKEHGIVLATRDERALDTYRSLDVRLELLS
jgi:hypothetical protein